MRIHIIPLLFSFILTNGISVAQKKGEDVPIPANVTHATYPFSGEYIGESKRIKINDEKVAVPHGKGTFTGYIVGSDTKQKVVSDGFNAKENKALSLLDQSWDNHEVGTSIAENENFVVETAVFLRRLKYTRRVPSTPNGGAKIKIFCDEAKKTFVTIKFEEYQLPSYNPNNASVVDVSSYAIAEAAFKNITLIHNIGGEKVVENYRAPKVDFSKYVKLKLIKNNRTLSLEVNDKEIFSLLLDKSFAAKSIVLDKDDSHDVFYDYVMVDKISFDERNKLVYNGEWDEGKFSGNGSLLFEKIELRGNFVDGFLTGIGTAQGPDYYFEGDFQNSVPEGKGKIRTNKYEYEGEVHQWFPHNLGTMKLIDRQIKDGASLIAIQTLPHVFTGNFINGKIKGKGKMTYPNGDILEGDWDEFKFTGSGKLFLANGSTYEGEWKNGKKHGKGVLFVKDKKVMEGEFVEDLFNGMANVRLADDGIYEGEMKLSKPDGKGKISYPNGDFIEGDFVAGLCTGKAKMKYMSAFSLNDILSDDNKMNGTYEGQIENGKPSGKGTFRSDLKFRINEYDDQGNLKQSEPKHLYLYEGDWVNGKKSGTGKLDFIELGYDSEIDSFFVMSVVNYTGTFNEDLFDGSGSLTPLYSEAETTSTYKGQFKAGKYEGMGELTTELMSGNQDKYIGSFINGEFYGKGKYTMKSLTIYEGDFVNGMREGNGKITYGEPETSVDDWGDEQVDSYEGTWKNDQAEGTGTLKFSNGKVVNGQFVGGKFMKPYTGPTATIGNQIWMAQNLNVSTFRNGDEIMEAKSVADWNDACRKGIPAWCYYNNDPTTAAKYGKIYNIYAVVDGRGLAPIGFHIPNIDETGQLIDAAQPEIVALRKQIAAKQSQGINTSDLESKLYNMEGNYGKSNAAYNLRSTKGWENNGSNRFGFNATPTAKRDYSGNFYVDKVGSFKIWVLSPDRKYPWTFDIEGAEFRDRAGYLLSPSISNTKVESLSDGYFEGFAVRCIKD